MEAVVCVCAKNRGVEISTTTNIMCIEWDLTLTKLRDSHTPLYLTAWLPVRIQRLHIFLKIFVALL